MVPEIKLDELKQRMDRGEPLLLVEALPPWKYRKQHIPGAINIPFNRVKRYAGKRVPGKGAEIIVYCGSFT
jgi:rhodanese-related sulfurtransferase